MPTTPEFVDLFDIEKRPGAGLELWTFALEMQLERVREANFKHRLAQSFNDDERIEDPDAVQHLHTEVYFLVLVIRRVLLFHDLLAKHADQRLSDARAEFERAAPHAKTFRDMYEHVNEYLLDQPAKRVKFPGRASPILKSRWDCDNVAIAFGDIEMDVTLAAVAAVNLGKASLAIWREQMDAARAGRPYQDVPPPPEGEITHTLEVTLGLSAIVGGEDEGRQRFVGTLLDTNVREATEEERASYRGSTEAPPPTGQS